eukprot:GEMP01023491.1.p1 GENE.GEMP01023491.1~~GEMP01023491.1.p1  ORF type:complete len:735 (+),score=121.75 GEMP01023491.1:274-2478(+)
MDLEGVARKGIRALRKTQISLGDQDAIARWSEATRSFCAGPGQADAAEWFRLLARDVVDFPQTAVKEVLRFQWYRTFGDPAVLLAYGHFILALSTACSIQVLGIVDSLVSFLSTPHQFPEGNQVSVGSSTFESPQALKQFCRKLLYGYLNDKDSAKVLDEDGFVFMKALLAFHPRSAEKMANGVEAITVGKHPSYPHNCFFVKNSKGELEDFSYRRCAENIKTPNYRTQRQICEIIRDILRLCPSCTLATAKMLEDRFPRPQSKTMQITDHRNYLQALLYLAELPVLTNPLLSFVLRKLSDLDIEVAEAADTSAVLADEESLDFSAQLLDVQMGVVFEFLQSRLGSRREAITKTDASSLALLTLGVFEEVTFMVHQSRHVQFIYFYICSLSAEWSEVFLIRLLRMLYSDQQSVEKRKQAQNYLGSMVVRAKFLSTKYTLQTTRYLIEWLNEQLMDIESRSPYSVDGEGWDPKWLMFHQSVEVVIYVLCWKAEEFHCQARTDIGNLWDSAEGDRSPLQVLFDGAEIDHPERAPKCRFADILKSPLRPTDRICPDMLRRFVYRMDKVAGSESWWTRLKPLVSAAGRDVQITDTMFAFEPYRLRNSHTFVKNIYRCWDEIEQRGPDDDDDAVQGFEFETQQQRMGRRDNEVSSTTSCASSQDVHMTIASPSPSFCPRQNEQDIGAPFSLDCLAEPQDMLSSLISSSAYACASLKGHQVGMRSHTEDPDWYEDFVESI